MKKSDSISPLPRAAARFQIGSAWANLLVLAAVCAAAYIGMKAEYFEGPVAIPLWHGHAIRFDIGSSDIRKYMLAAIYVIMAVSLQLINGVSGQFSLGHAGFMAIGAYLSGYASLTFGTLTADNSATSFQNVGAVAWFFIVLAIVSAAAAMVLGVLGLVLLQSRRVARWLPPLLIMAALAWITWDISEAFYLESPGPHFVWTHMSRGLSTFFTHAIDAGLAPATKFSSFLPALIRRPLCLIILLAGGGVFAAAAGLLVGLPTLRLRGDYLAIVTLGFAEILRVLLTNFIPFGRSTGLSVTPYWNQADPDNDPVTHYIFPWILALAVLSVAAVWRIAFSPKGRLIRAVREDEIASAAVGINAARQKVTAFVVGAFFAGIGGVLYVHREGYVSPTLSGMDLSLLFVVMVTLGGLGSISGAILAAIVLTLIPFDLREWASTNNPALSNFLHLLASPRWQPLGLRSWLESPALLTFFQKWLSNQNALLALVLIFTMLLRPKGLLGGIELWPRRRRRPLAASPLSPAPAALELTPAPPVSSGGSNHPAAAPDQDTAPIVASTTAPSSPTAAPLPPRPPRPEFPPPLDSADPSLLSFPDQQPLLEERP